MRILLVDDDVFLRDMYEVKFVEAGHDVETAESGKEALRLVSEHDAFDVIVMDLVMPVMTGFDLMEALADEKKAAAALKVILSNQGGEGDRKEAKRAGVDGFIIKAESIPSEVVKEVEALMART